MDALKALGSSVPLWSILVAAVLAGMALFVWPRTRRFARHWLLWVTGAYVVFGTPAVANAIAAALPAPAVPVPASPVRALIVLDGDNRRGRLREAVRVLRRDDPPVVWILGDEWFLDELEAAGFLRSRFRRETEASNTREQMDWVAGFAARHPEAPPAVVASRLQLPRVEALSRVHGSRLGFVISPVDDEPPTSGWRRWMPSYVGLRASRDAIYEHAALWWYRWNGWIA